MIHQLLLFVVLKAKSTHLVLFTSIPEKLMLRKLTNILKPLKILAVRANEFTRIPSDWDYWSVRQE